MLTPDQQTLYRNNPSQSENHKGTPLQGFYLDPGFSSNGTWEAADWKPVLHQAVRESFEFWPRPEQRRDCWLFARVPQKYDHIGIWTPKKRTSKERKKKGCGFPFGFPSLQNFLTKGTLNKTSTPRGNGVLGRAIPFNKTHRGGGAFSPMFLKSRAHSNMLLWEITMSCAPERHRKDGYWEARIEEPEFANRGSLL